ncbi:hypothetical protein ABT294_33050 [Nonomuraea sp. NPDC000554]|uniref:hypothetical protein n=1 Tax=Nonomuraea sp. NPDC000554 TaxID=3154259 RepID=UPI0033280AEE
MDALRKALGALSVVYALVFCVGAVLHTGVAIGPLSEPVIPPATIAETLCAVAVAVGAYGALSGRPWAWNGLIYTHAGALSGVLLGILALAFGAGEATTLNTWYHRIMATLLTAGLGGALYVSRVRR